MTAFYTQKNPNAHPDDTSISYWRGDMTTTFNSAALRQLLITALTDDDLTRLAYDYFRPVY